MRSCGRTPRAATARRRRWTTPSSWCARAEAHASLLRVAAGAAGDALLRCSPARPCRSGKPLSRPSSGFSTSKATGWRRGGARTAWRRPSRRRSRRRRRCCTRRSARGSTCRRCGARSRRARSGRARAGPPAAARRVSTRPSRATSTLLRRTRWIQTATSMPVSLPARLLICRDALPACPVVVE